MNKSRIKRLYKEDTVWKFFIQICLGLNYLHSQNILHRDLKSPNVFMDAKYRLQLGDLGVAKYLGSDPATQTQIGTPYYLSPEIWSGRKYDAKSDVWSLGVLLYELCTLRHPFDGKTQKQLGQRVLRGTYVPVGDPYSDDLCQMVSWLLNQDPNKRPDVHQILTCPAVMKRMHLVPGNVDGDDLVAISSERHNLMETIHCPKNLTHLSHMLPAPQYSPRRPSVSILSEDLDKALSKFSSNGSSGGSSRSTTSERSTNSGGGRVKRRVPTHSSDSLEDGRSPAMRQASSVSPKASKLPGGEAPMRKASSVSPQASQPHRRQAGVQLPNLDRRPVYGAAAVRAGNAYVEEQRRAKNLEPPVSNAHVRRYSVHNYSKHPGKQVPARGRGAIGLQGMGGGGYHANKVNIGGKVHQSGAPQRPLRDYRRPNVNPQNRAPFSYGEARVARNHRRQSGFEARVPHWVR